MPPKRHASRDPSKPTQAGSTTPKEHPAPPGADIAYENAADFLNGQFRRQELTDAKAAGLLAAAGLVAGFFLSSESILVNAPKALSALSMVSVTVTSVLAACSLWPRDFTTAPAPRTLASRAAKFKASPSQLRWDFVTDVIEAGEKTKGVVNNKVRCLRRAAVGFVVTLGIMSVAVGWSLFPPERSVCSTHLRPAECTTPRPSLPGGKHT